MGKASTTPRRINWLHGLTIVAVLGLLLASIGGMIHAAAAVRTADVQTGLANQLEIATADHQAQGRAPDGRRLTSPKRSR